MPARFAELEDRLSAAVDGMFGEVFRFHPMTQATVNSRLGPDTNRSIFLFTAVIDDRNPGSTSFARLGSTSGGTASRDAKPAYATSNPMLFFDISGFGDRTPPRRLDRVERLDTGAVYELTSIEKDGQGRFKAGMVRVA